MNQICEYKLIKVKLQDVEIANSLEWDISIKANIESNNNDLNLINKKIKLVDITIAVIYLMIFILFYIIAKEKEYSVCILFLIFICKLIFLIWSYGKVMGYLNNKLKELNVENEILKELNKKIEMEKIWNR